jgi:2,3-bisphosphoglycerate-dependent phosphoglycerate mutase
MLVLPAIKTAFPGVRMHSQGARLWLVRHGQTDWNATGRIQGHTPTELNAAGRVQAEALAQQLSGKTFAAVWSSDLPRALQTAEFLAQPRGMRVQTTELLRERSFGQYEGATSDEIRAARTSLGLEQTGDLADWTGMPGIESNDALWERVAGFLRELSDRYADQDVLVVTHGGVIARAVYRVLGIADGVPRRFPLSNGIVAILQYRQDAFYLLSLVDMGLVVGNRPYVDTATMQPSAHSPSA